MTTDLYGVPLQLDIEPLSLYAITPDMHLYALAEAGHEDCWLSTFCRHPLHPGPCKGWKHMLHGVSPGAWHALERRRIDTANARRKARIAALKAAGKKVPPRLEKEIPYPAANAVPTGPKPVLWKPPTPDQAKKALPKTSTQIAADIAARRAAAKPPGVPVPAVPVAPSALPKREQHAVDAGQTLINSAAALGATLTTVQQEKATQHIHDVLGKLKPGEKLSDDRKISATINGIVKRAVDAANSAGKPLTPKQAVDLRGDIVAHVDAGVPDTPILVTSAANHAGLKSVAPPSPPKNPPSSPPSASPNAPSAVKTTPPKATPLATPKPSNAPATKTATSSAPSSAPSAGPAKAAPAKTLAPAAAAKAPTPAKASAPAAPAKATTPVPAGPAPVRAVSATNVQQATVVAQRKLPGAGVAKKQIPVYGKLTKDDYDSLPQDVRDKIDADLTTAHAKFLDPKKQAEVKALQDRFGGGGGVKKSAPPAAAPAASAPAPTPAPAPKPVSTFPQLDALKAEKDPVKIAQAWGDTWSKARTAEQTEALEKHRQAIQNDPGQPAWLRTMMYHEGPNVHPTAAGHVAGEPPSPNGTWFPTQTKVNTLFDISPASLAKQPPYVHQAITERRNQGVRDLLNSGQHQTTLRMIFGSENDDLEKYNTLDPKAKQGVDSALRMVRDSTGSLRPDRASKWQKAIDHTQGITYTGAQRKALDAIHDTYGNPTMADFAGLSRSDFQALAPTHQQAITFSLQKIQSTSLSADKIKIRHLEADLKGNAPNYASSAANDSAWAAGRDKGDLSALDRVAIHGALTVPQFDDLSPGDRANVSSDMSNLANPPRGVTSQVSLKARHSLQRRLDTLKKDIRPNAAADAIEASDPLGSGWIDPTRIAAYTRLSQSDFAALPSVYQEAIDEDLINIGVNNPNAYNSLMQKLHPGWTPPHAPATPVTTAPATGPVKDTLDVLYGQHPKSSHVSHQLKTYGSLPLADFNRLQPHEQTTLLSDLSYIATTSVGPNKSKAQKLIDRFTPPGTAAGTIPPQPMSIPANAVAGQNRVADPAGTPGLLVQATNKGVSGDGFTRKVNGGSGPWGKYGAAGLMLRHVDTDGTTRYLMIERGPGISDPGKWQFPGGAIDSQETPHQGATRETIEELGFKGDALKDARVHGEHVFTVPGVIGPPNNEWKYSSIVATVPTMLKADLSTSHARAETAQAKWMTADEIKALDTKGKLLKPLAGGQLEKNVMSLFPAAAPAGPGRPGPRTTKAPRLTGTPMMPKPAKAHKPSKGKDLLSDTAAKNKLRQDVKQARGRFAGKVADDRLAAIGEMQGFDDVPTVRTRTEIDALLATGDYIEAWRGVRGSYRKNAADINEEMRTGPAYYGRGVFGNGYYLATQRSVAKQYSDGTKNSVVRMLIPKEAAIKLHADMVREAHANSSSRSKAKGSGYEDGTLWDEGRYAAAKGVDGIEIRHTSGGGQGLSARHVAQPGKPAYNWLNRSVLIMQEAD